MGEEVEEPAVDTIKGEIARYTSDPDEVERVLQIIEMILEPERDRPPVESFVYMCGRALMDQLLCVMPACSKEAVSVCIAGQLMGEERYWLRDGVPNNMAEARGTVLRFIENSMGTLRSRQSADVAED